MFTSHRLLPVTLAVVIVGCHAGSSSPEDQRDDAFLQDGKADSGAISQGEALGVLKLANTASDEVLRDQTDGVGLADRTVDNMMYFRLGDDGIPSTADDGSFHTLAELDAIPFLGPLAFTKLLGFARAHGYIQSAAGRVFASSRTDRDFGQIRWPRIRSIEPPASRGRMLDGVAQTATVAV